MFLRPLAAAAIMLVAFPSHADLVIDPSPAQSPAQATAPGRVVYVLPEGSQADPAKRTPVVAGSSASGPVSYADVNRVIETGGPRPAGSLEPVNGWADDVPLDLALSQVVPAGWSIYADDVKGSDPVSWSGGRPWTQVLGDLAYRGRFAANVQWDNKRVVLYRAGHPAPSESSLSDARVVRGGATAPASSAVVITPTNTAHEPVAVGVPCCKPVVKASEASVVVAPVSTAVIQPQAQPVVQMASTQKWLIDPRLSLKQNVEAWVRQAGWSALVWEAADYEMVAPAVFEGDFTSKDGPLAKLINAYANSDQPLRVELSTQDRVVHVTNKNYQPAVVTPLTPSQVFPSPFNK